MALASELSIRSKIVTLLKTVNGIGPVYPRVRRPKDGTLGELQRLFFDSGNRVNVWMVRRVKRTPEVDQFNNIQKVVLTYALIGFYGVVDDDDDTLASETIFQAMIENAAAALEADFGIDGVSHRGLEIPVDIEDKMLGDYLCHEAICRLTVDVEDC